MNRIYQLAFTQTKTNHAVYQIVESLARLDYFTFFFEKKQNSNNNNKQTKKKVLMISFVLAHQNVSQQLFFFKLS